MVKPSSSVKDPCGICDITVKIGHQAIQCDSCELWVHIGCNGTSQNDYEFLTSKSEFWYCPVCNIKKNLDRLPFTHCDNTELININHNKSMRFLESFPNVVLISETITISDSFNEISNELPIAKQVVTIIQ